MEFGGYLFQQTGRLYPRDIQGVLLRLKGVAIGKFDNSMLTYPYAEGPRYSMVACELSVTKGFEDALNIDRDSFNELHPHFLRAQSYLHGLLHDLIFPETWSEEKKRNLSRRQTASQRDDGAFRRRFREIAGEPPPTLQLPTGAARKGRGGGGGTPQQDSDRLPAADAEVANLLVRRKDRALVERIVLAFERSNREATPERRRALFYPLLAAALSKE